MKNTDTELKYITTSKQALQHLVKTLKGKDLWALKVLARDIDMMHYKDKDQHWLLAKLYVAVLCSEIEKTGSYTKAIDTVDIYVKRPWENHLIILQGRIDAYTNCKVRDSADEVMDHSKLEPGKIPSLEKKIPPHAIELDDLKERMIKKINIALNDEKNYG